MTRYNVCKVSYMDWVEIPIPKSGYVESGDFLRHGKDVYKIMQVIQRSDGYVARISPIHKVGAMTVSEAKPQWK